MLYMLLKVHDQHHDQNLEDIYLEWLDRLPLWLSDRVTALQLDPDKERDMGYSWR